MCRVDEVEVGWGEEMSETNFCKFYKTLSTSEYVYVKTYNTFI